MLKYSILQVKFDDSVKEYNKVDGILAIAYFLYLVAFLVLSGLFLFRSNWGNQLFNWIKTIAISKILLYTPIVLIEAGPVFIILKCRKQSLKSIGLKKEKILKCILLGVLFAVLPTLWKMSSLKFGHLLNLPDALLTFVYLFFEIAFVEEVIFRGFIQTRIQGLIRSKWFSIILVGIMFSSMHIPLYMIEYNTTFINYFLSHSVSLLLIFLMHIYFVYLYTRDNNILAPVVAHVIVDFIPVLFSAM